MNRLFFSFILGLLAVPLAAKAQTTVTTTPVGYITYTIPATNGAQTTTTYISFPLLNNPAYSGAVTALTSNTLTVAGTPWTAGQFAAAGSPFFVKISSGLEAGRFLLVTANTANTLTVDVTDHSSQTTPLDGSGFAVQVNDRIEIIAGDTLASVLGDGSISNPVQLVGGTSAFTADAVSIYNPSLGRSFSYYFNTTRNAWNSGASGVVSQNGLILYPDMAIGITRRPNRPALVFQLQGRVPDVTPLTKTTGGSTSAIYSSTRFPVDVTLASLNIPGWTKSNSVFTADTIAVWDPSLGRWFSYFQRADNNQWRKSGDTLTDQSNFVIPAGAGIQILKRSTVSGQSSFMAVSMPYTP
ncbi:MAG: TIGR02597 family protein [Methylacidiphilales bacterium]|nr:TIGR02597 family protein [Candidatus Methylacidiphilales bacterium]